LTFDQTNIGETGITVYLFLCCISQEKMKAFFMLKEPYINKEAKLLHILIFVVRTKGDFYT